MRSGDNNFNYFSVNELTILAHLMQFKCTKRVFVLSVSLGLCFSWLHSSQQGQSLHA